MASPCGWNQLGEPWNHGYRTLVSHSALSTCGKTLLFAAHSFVQGLQWTEAQFKLPELFRKGDINLDIIFDEEPEERETDALSVLGSSSVGLVDLFWSWALLQSGSDLLNFINFCLGLFFLILLCCLVSLALCVFFFICLFPFLRTHRPDPLCWFPSLCIVQVLQSAGLTGPRGMLPVQGAVQPAQGGINSSCANSSSRAGTGSDWETHRSRKECSWFLMGTSWGLKKSLD